MESFTISIQYTAQDLQQACRIHNRKIYPVGSKLWLILGAISLAIGAVLLIYSYLFINYNNWVAWFLVLYGVVDMLYYFWRAGTMGKRMFGKMPDFRHPYEYRFSEKGVAVKSASTNSENTWDYYTKYVITDDLILLYPNKFRFNFFARKYFTDEQYRQLQSWIRNNVPLPFIK